MTDHTHHSADQAPDGVTRERFLARDLGVPVLAGTQFVRIGVPSHQRRAIALDVIVRQFISEPFIEYYSDHSLRYYVAPRSEQIWAAVWRTENLPAYCTRMARHGWVYLLTPLCKNCFRPHTEHPCDKCLFEPTKWAEHQFDDGDRL